MANNTEKNNEQFLDGSLLAQMAQGGAALLRSNAEEVNKLNVFPVPDGDTGDNMRMTIESGIAALEKVNSTDLAEVMQTLSRGMLLGARGNSGVILSQLFAGMAKGFESCEKADANTIGHALTLGVKQAYSSVMTPTEGTILTVARESVEYAVARITGESTIRSFFGDLVKEMHASLNRTPDLLTTLKEYKGGEIRCQCDNFVILYINISHRWFPFRTTVAVIQQNQIKTGRRAVADIYTVIGIMPGIFEQFIAGSAAQRIHFFAADAEKTGDFDIILFFCIIICWKRKTGGIGYTAVVLLHQSNIGSRQFIAQLVFNRSNQKIVRCIIHIFF